ncbi:hypothetical protein ABIB40_002911 [Pedobacter sp. UYP30]|uniref:beta-1,6-N-acetylglucosaminyltransferase n=1 Tax=Pedobacter sp. UYP30 TaxID=1756400 RepID=UPI0033954E27
MIINYLILVHKNFSQLDRMIKALDGNGVFFYVHVDRDFSRSIEKCDFLTAENVKIISKSFSVNWGGFSMVKATIELINESVKSKNKGYHVLISGQDFPIMSKEIIFNKLSANYGLEYIEYWPLPYKKWAYGGRNRIEQYWFIDKIGLNESTIIANLQKINGFVRNGLFDFPIFGGSQWWCLTYECICYVLKFIKKNRVIINYFELTLIPDELFFQTILLNSLYRDRIVNDNLRYIDFEKGSSHPKTLKKSCLKSLQSSGKLWARKFDNQQDSEILDLIEFSIKQKNDGNNLIVY